MKSYSAQFIFTNTGEPLKRGVITIHDDGTILDVEDTKGSLAEKSSVEFHNGIIIPGFVNCHCHLELSHMKGVVQKHSGLARFLIQLQNTRDTNADKIIATANSADHNLFSQGTELCADICNTSMTFSIKKKSHINYVNLLEVFGSDPLAAESRMNHILNLNDEAQKAGLTSSIVPHTPYSVSLPLFRLIRKATLKNRVTSIHFMETEDENELVTEHSGSFYSTLSKAGMISGRLETPHNVTSAILNELTPSGSLILVHNTFADRDTVRKILERENTYWCLCPNANLYIENKVPPVEMLISEGCKLVIGTDSLASNDSLSVLEEIKTIQIYFPSIKMEDLLRWATINGARALGEEANYGTIRPGIKPGLLLLENADLVNMKFTPETTVKRLV